MSNDTSPGLTDTNGIDADRFTLDWDGGSSFLPDVQGDTLALIADTLWEWYRSMVSIQIWVLDWVLGMDWLGYILAPLAGLSIIVKGMVAQVGLLNLMLVILAFVVGFWLIKGRYAGGFVELLIGCLLAALAAGFLADPMARIGGDDGVIVQSRDAGMDIATGFATDGASFTQDQTAIRDGLKTALVDTMIRTPHQIVNYGDGLDDGACKDVYNKAVGRDGAAGTIGECAGSQAAETASGATAATVVSVGALLSSGFVFLLLSLVIVGGTIFAVLLLGWSAIKLLWQLPVGVVSSGARAQLFRTFASVGFGMVLVGMATVFIVAWMRVLLGFYDATSGLPFLVRLYLFNTLILAGAVFYVLMGASIRQALRTMADKVAAAGVPSQVGEPQAMPWGAENRKRWATQHSKVRDFLGVGVGPAPVTPNENSVSIKDDNATPVSATGQTMTQEIPTESAAERLTNRLGDSARTVADVGARVAAGAIPGGPAAVGAVDGSRALADAFRGRAEPAKGPASEWTSAASSARAVSTATALPPPYKSHRSHIPATQDPSIQLARKAELKRLLSSAARRS